MKKIRLFFLLILITAFFGCEPDDPSNPDDDNPLNSNIGIVEFDFEIPARNVPASGVHRIDLSLAINAYNLYRGDFLISANVSDRVRVYSFNLAPGDYYYQAGVTCSCLGDTCLWDNFPGGRYGTKWTLGQITIVKGERLNKNLVFNN